LAGISTHVLDITSGQPGVGMRIEFSVLDGAQYKLVKELRTNQEGRTDSPVLAPDEARAGQYELVFHVGEYYASRGLGLPDPAFIDQVPVRFTVFDATQHFHVPMLCSPWSCTTYRGS